MKSKNYNGRSTSLCYLERDGKYLILYRTKKQDDENGDKWIGVGGSRSPKALARKRRLLDAERQARAGAKGAWS